MKQCNLLLHHQLRLLPPIVQAQMEVVAAVGQARSIKADSMFASIQPLVYQRFNRLAGSIEDSQRDMLVCAAEPKIYRSRERVGVGQDVKFGGRLMCAADRAAVYQWHIREVREQQRLHIGLFHLEPIHQHRAIDVAEIVLHRNGFLYFRSIGYFGTVACETGLYTGAEKHQWGSVAVVGTEAIIGADAAAKLAEGHR